jgi:hypothetical protein
MGIRFNTNTWRAPLQLIDSWLPAPTLKQQANPGAKVVRLLTRAGWLGTRGPDLASDTNGMNRLHTTFATRSHRVHVVRKTDPASSDRTDARLVISGRIKDVCDELERLAALEHQSLRKQA